MKTDTELLDFIESHRVLLTYVLDFAGTPRQWRCCVDPRHFDRPDIRERSKRIGFGKTARKAIREAMEYRG